jgi:hypothetical protein
MGPSDGPWVRSMGFSSMGFPVYRVSVYGVSVYGVSVYGVSVYGVSGLWGSYVQWVHCHSCRGGRDSFLLDRLATIEGSMWTGRYGRRTGVHERSRYNHVRDPILRAVLHARARVPNRPASVGSPTVDGSSRVCVCSTRLYRSRHGQPTNWKPLSTQ